MNIITDEEIALICADCALVTPSDIYFARAIEAAIMAKFEVVTFYECHGCGHMAMDRVTSCDCMSDLGIHEKQLYALKEKASPKPIS